MMIKRFEPPQNLLPAAADKGDDLPGTEKTVAIDEADNFAIAFRKRHGDNCIYPLEAGKTAGHCPAMV